MINTSLLNEQRSLILPEVSMAQTFHCFSFDPGQLNITKQAERLPLMAAKLAMLLN